jgi:DNA-binding NarL/FixJ family response regulator
MHGNLIPSAIKVLMVEDSALIVSRVETMINEIAGVEFVGSSGNVPAALELIRLAAPEVVILDINLGSHDGKNGINLLNILRQLYPDLKIIMLTNMSESRYRSLCTHYGADYFLDKSNDFDSIPEILMTLAELKKSVS